jgi:hypothetical protein
MTVQAKTFDASSVAFGEVAVRDGRVTVPITTPVRVVTDVAELANHLSDAEGSVNPFVTIKFRNPADAAFFEAFESHVVEAAKEDRKAWFSGEPEDERIESSLKSFAKSGTLKVRTSKFVEAFSSDGTQIDARDVFLGDSARLLLVAKEVKIGKVEFGVMWTLEQLKIAKKTTCLIEDDVSDGEVDIDDLIV